MINCFFYLCVCLVIVFVFLRLCVFESILYLLFFLFFNDKMKFICIQGDIGDFFYR